MGSIITKILDNKLTSKDPFIDSYYQAKRDGTPFVGFKSIYLYLDILLWDNYIDLDNVKAKIGYPCTPEGDSIIQKLLEYEKLGYFIDDNNKYNKHFAKLYYNNPCNDESSYGSNTISSISELQEGINEKNKEATVDYLRRLNNLKILEESINKYLAGPKDKVEKKQWKAIKKQCGEVNLASETADKELADLLGIKLELK